MLDDAAIQDSIAIEASAFDSLDALLHPSTIERSGYYCLSAYLFDPLCVMNFMVSASSHGG